MTQQVIVQGDAHFSGPTVASQEPDPSEDLATYSRAVRERYIDNHFVGFPIPGAVRVGPNDAFEHARRHNRQKMVMLGDPGSGRTTQLQRWECETESKEVRHDSPLLKVARKAGLRRIGWHTLRHTYASHLTMRGGTPAEAP